MSAKDRKSYLTVYYPNAWRSMTHQQRRFLLHASVPELCRVWAWCKGDDFVCRMGDSLQLVISYELNTLCPEVGVLEELHPKRKPRRFPKESIHNPLVDVLVALI